MCVLRVYGANFDAESFLAGDTRLEPCAVFWPGVPAYDKRVARGRNSDHGFHVTVSDREWSDWEGQVSDALAFLEEHQEVLEQLTGRSDVDTVTLDFPADAHPDAQAIVCDQVFPATLIRAAGRAGVAIELTVYVAGSETEHATDPDE